MQHPCGSGKNPAQGWGPRACLRRVLAYSRASEIESRRDCHSTRANDNTTKGVFAGGWEMPRASTWPIRTHTLGFYFCYLLASRAGCLRAPALKPFLSKTAPFARTRSLHLPIYHNLTRQKIAPTPKILGVFDTHSLHCFLARLLAVSDDGHVPLFILPVAVDPNLCLGVAHA